MSVAVRVAIGEGGSLIATGLVRLGSVGTKTARRIVSSDKMEPRLQTVGEQFSDALRDTIVCLDARRKTGELTGVADNWNDVVEELSADSDAPEERAKPLMFDDLETAVDRITEAIAVAAGFNLDRTPQLAGELKQAVARAYQDAIVAFANDIAGTRDGDWLLTVASLQTLGELHGMGDQLETLAEFLGPRVNYMLFSGTDTCRDRAIGKLDVSREIEYVERPELENATAEKLLLLGRGGTGKSRAMAERLLTYDSPIEHVLWPRPEFQHPTDVWPFQQEDFKGDVLLLWDDLHNISEDHNKTIIEKTIRGLDRQISTQGFDFHVLGAAR